MHVSVCRRICVCVCVCVFTDPTSLRSNPVVSRCGGGHLTHWTAGSPTSTARLRARDQRSASAFVTVLALLFSAQVMCDPGLDQTRAVPWTLWTQRLCRNSVDVLHGRGQNCSRHRSCVSLDLARLTRCRGPCDHRG